MWWSSKNSPLTELYKINSGLESPNVNIIFVHGLDGDAYATWNFDDDVSWHKWLSKEFPNADVWSLKYRINSTNILGGSMSLQDRSINVLHILKNEIKASIPIVFVCHSYGGLLVKQLLRSSRDFPRDFGEIARETRAICFFSTPHQGAVIASYISNLSSILPSAAIRELRRNEPSLRNLNQWFRSHPETEKLQIKVFYEDIPTRGVIIVDASSADIGISNVIPIPIDSDHIDICKPRNLDGRVKEVFKLVKYAAPARSEAVSNATPIGMVLAASNAEIPALIDKFEAEIATDPSNTQTRHALRAARDIEARIRGREPSAQPISARKYSIMNTRVSFIAACFLLFIGGSISIYRTGGIEGASQSALKEFSAVGGHVKVGCQQSGTSNVIYTAPSGYHIGNAFANVQDPQQLGSSSARIVSNDGKTVRAIAEIRGRDREWTGNCPSGGSGQVKVTGTLEKDDDKGFISKFFDRIF